MNPTACNDEHQRIIIHIDLDCFYAQVEILKNPELKNIPMGIQQKNIVVTSNYKAREFGIRKCMLLNEAMQLCPHLVLVNGEDLSDYRSISYKVTSLLQKYSEYVERLGLDENFIDATKLVEEKLKNINKEQIQSIGNIFGSTENLCQCGCEIKVKVGTLIAAEMRKLIYEQLGLTSCAGIAHNKLLSKIICSKHKPNQQTFIYPDSALELMLSLSSVESVPGVGRVTSEILKQVNVKSIEELQNVEISKLNKLFDPEKAKFLKNLSYGVDNTLVKRSGKPLSIGLEDSCKLISAEKEVKEKLTELLKRLMLLVDKDGRIPKTIKLTVRTFDKMTKTSRRQTKQSNINSQFFTSSGPLIKLHNLEKILLILMNLFRKLVTIHRPFHITLLGLSFTKFIERMDIRHSIASFIKNDIEVQSITSIENLNYDDSSPESAAQSPSSCRESSDPESEPTPKRTKLNIFKRNLMEYDTCDSPSKLRVQDLQLSSEKHDNNLNIKCPPNADKSVFEELPLEVQQELWFEFKRTRMDSTAFGNRQKKLKSNSLLNYFVKQ
ncbi:hypothetical protein WA026_018632 [Henosepilachna vigintioctopunctata]|uniref:UmuC domain-containing protein n=1 Tax=Henosepilachna vigintioctopunctata TaxID=420089 RepID=A0AAW1U4Z0_9CUCU